MSEEQEQKTIDELRQVVGEKNKDLAQTTARIADEL